MGSKNYSSGRGIDLAEKDIKSVAPSSMFGIEDVIMASNGQSSFLTRDGDGRSLKAT